MTVSSTARSGMEGSGDALLAALQEASMTSVCLVVHRWAGGGEAAGAEGQSVVADLVEQCCVVR